MKKTFNAIAFIGIIAWLLAVSCTKFDTTKLGTDIIPEVDNITTFADTLDIISSQGIFTNEDTVKMNSADGFLVGQISNDPDFGTTKAELFFEPKPFGYPYYIGDIHDTILQIDSLVLCLSYKGFYGDSSVVQQLQLFEVDGQADSFWKDSTILNRPITYAPPLLPTPISNIVPVDVRTLRNYQKISKGKDSVVNQIRLKILPGSAFATLFAQQDSSLTGPNNGFRNDSLFRSKFSGFGIKSLSGNSILYTMLTDDATRLEIHFKKRKNNVVDTSFSVLKLDRVGGARIKASSFANHIQRDRSTGTYPLPGLPADEIYLQTTPGTFADLSIPGLTGYPKRIIHRAQITIEQAPSSNFLYDSIFSAPPYLYLDLKDTGVNNRYKPIYEDLNPLSFYNPDFMGGLSVPVFPYSVDYNYYGGAIRKKYDPISGRNISYYVFNVSRFVQKISKQEISNYGLRIFAPYQIFYKQYGNYVVAYNNPLAYGRIKVGGGGNSNYKMRMVIIYSLL